MDLAICLGGDGTLLYMSTMFQRHVPPVLCFSLGTLGFLTPFQIADYPAALAKVVEGTLVQATAGWLYCWLGLGLGLYEFPLDQNVY